LRTSEAALFHALRYLECDPDVPGASAEEMLINIERCRDRYLVRELGQSATECLDANAVVEFLHRRVFDLSVADRPDTPLIHAASLRWRGRRVMLLGAKSVGKTTLTLNLLGVGYEFEGDEHVFVTGEGIIARPRAIRVKQASLALLPDLAPAIATAPYLIDYRGQKIYNLDPRHISSTWRIERGPVDVIVALKPNHGGYSSSRPMSSLKLVQDLVQESGFPSPRRGPALGSIVRTLGRSQAFDMSVGEHTGAIDCINCMLEARL
jgi:hypothetical protein